MELISGEDVSIWEKFKAVVFEINRVPNLGKISKSIRNSFKDSASVWKMQFAVPLLSSVAGRRMFLGTMSEILDVIVIRPGFKSVAELNKLMQFESLGKINSMRTFCSKKLWP